MKTYYIHIKTKELQDDLYSKLNKFSEKHKVLGRLCSLPVSLIDVTIDVLRLPLLAIEHVALAALNLVGAAFFQEYTLKDALFYTEVAVANVVCIPVKLAVTPLRIAFQFFAILIDPTKVQSSNYMNPTFKA